MGTVLHEQPDPVRVQSGQMRVLPHAAARCDYRVPAVQRVRPVLGDELRDGLFANGAGPNVRLVVLGVPQKGRAVLHAHRVRAENYEVRSCPKRPYRNYNSILR